MREEEGFLMNFPKYHGDRATSATFSQRCRKTYRTDLVNYSLSSKIGENFQIFVIFLCYVAPLISMTAEMLL